MLDMMKPAVVWAIFALCLCWCAPMARTQDCVFRGSDVVKLSSGLAADARDKFQLAAAYRMPLASGGSRVLSAVNAFELLARGLKSWKEQGTFPEQIPLQLDTLQGPAIDPKAEPQMNGDVVAVPTTDIATYAAAWLSMAETQGRLPRDMKFGLSDASHYRLTAAQFVVAMAIVIDEATLQQRYPSAISVPRVRSPLSWQGGGGGDAGVVNLVPPPKPRLNLTILLNGRDMTDIKIQTQRLPLPSCGALRMEIHGSGPVETVQVLLDGVEQRTFDGPGAPHRLTLDSAVLTDGPHMMTVTARGGDETRPATYIFSFEVRNGRESGFTPMEP